MNKDNQPRNRRSPRSSPIFPISATFRYLCLVLAVALGVLIGRALGGGPVAADTTGTEATATRESELDELHDLQTQIAALQAQVAASPASVICTPAPTPTSPPPTPTPTPVPPAGVGQEMPYADAWTVVVTGAAPASSSEVVTPQGKFVQVGVKLTNNGSSPRPFPFQDWILVDDQGRTFVVSRAGSTDILGPSWYLAVPPSLPTDLAVVFDVAADAGPSFIIESTTDPTFRVAIELQQRG